MTGQVRRSNPRQDQKPAVISQMDQTALPLRDGPADKLVSGGHFPSGRAKQQTSYFLAVTVPHQIMKLPQNIGITQIMMLRQRARHLGAFRLARQGLMP